MATPLVVELLSDGKLTTVKRASLLVVTHTGALWVTNKSSPSLTVVATNVVVVDAGWYMYWQQGKTLSVSQFNVGGTIPLTGGGGTQWNVFGPLP